jgi:hypothetical protein
LWEHGTHAKDIAAATHAGRAIGLGVASGRCGEDDCLKTVLDYVLRPPEEN